MNVARRSGECLIVTEVTNTSSEPAETLFQTISDSTLDSLARRLHCDMKPWLSAPNDQPEENLKSLISDYFSLLPSCIDQFRDRCGQIGWADLAEQMIEIMTSYLKDENIKLEPSLLDSIGPTYFAYRILEEVQDYLLCSQATALLDWDVAKTNIIMRALLADDFADKLDSTAIELSTMIIKTAPTPRANKAQPKPANQLICFCQQHQIDLRF